MGWLRPCRTEDFSSVNAKTYGYKPPFRYALNVKAFSGWLQTPGCRLIQRQTRLIRLLGRATRPRPARAWARPTAGHGPRLSRQLAFPAAGRYARIRCSRVHLSTPLASSNPAYDALRTVPDGPRCPVRSSMSTGKDASHATSVEAGQEGGSRTTASAS